MSAVNTKSSAKTENSRGKKKSQLQLIWHQFKKNKGAVIGLVMLFLIVAIAIAAGFIYDFNKDICMLSRNRLITPCLEHPFGTDNMGRSVMARVFYGARYSLLIGVVVVFVSTSIGTSLGAIAGYYGGKIENIIMRVVELFLMIPSILLGIGAIFTFL